ncbi:AVAST type 1 anti-phage system protein Avs1c [Sphingobacterium sp. MYb388]|uniref:AVAST type 1 anti-phage system protein Avs1c n=1 Tax=Sphingobacterium sp. MYb388 TaxID=2745437 RepID=UPI0030A3058D
MPTSRKEFERNMFFLSEGFEKDLIVINKENIKSIKGIENVRYAPNNRANLNTVNEMARLMANTVARLSSSKETMSED